jgi:chaperonin cofactor prefoldin
LVNLNQVKLLLEAINQVHRQLHQVQFQVQEIQQVLKELVKVNKNQQTSSNQ